MTRYHFPIRIHHVLCVHTHTVAPQAHLPVSHSQPKYFGSVNLSRSRFPLVALPTGPNADDLITSLNAWERQHVTPSIHSNKPEKN
jgi:hypothetical protein